MLARAFALSSLVLGIAVSCASEEPGDDLVIEEPPAKGDSTSEVIDFYPDRDHEVEADCDHPYKMTMFKNRLGGYSATLDHTLTAASTCEIVNPNDHYYLAFFTHPAADSCGIRKANFGYVELDMDGQPVRGRNGRPVVHEGRYTDYRQATCEPVIPAAVVLDLGGMMLYANPPPPSDGASCASEIAIVCEDGAKDGCIGAKTTIHVCVPEDEQPGASCAQEISMVCPDGQIDACDRTPRASSRHLCVVE